MFRTAGSHPKRAGSESRAGVSSRGPSPQGHAEKRAGRGETRARWGDALAVVGAGLVLAAFTTTATAAPCGKHRGDARAACLDARAKQAYPPSPSWNEALARLTPYEEASLLAIGRCEMGTTSPGYTKPRRGFPPVASPWASLRWGLNYSRYSTAFGIWNGNGAYIRSATGGYSFPGATPAEELLGAKALADGPARGFSGWACHGRG